MLARNEFVLRAQALAMAEACLSKQELSLLVQYGGPSLKRAPLPFGLHGAGDS